MEYQTVAIRKLLIWQGDEELPVCVVEIVDLHPRLWSVEERRSGPRIPGLRRGKVSWVSTRLSEAVLWRALPKRSYLPKKYASCRRIRALAQKGAMDFWCTANMPFGAEYFSAVDIVYWRVTAGWATVVST